MLDLVGAIVTYIIFVAQNTVTALQAFSHCAHWATQLTPGSVALVQISFYIPLCWYQPPPSLALPLPILPLALPLSPPISATPMLAMLLPFRDWCKRYIPRTANAIHQ